ncbi:MAG: hypothetical protein LIP16_13175 [Clostridium sp.]|nr:hypothetical protein [Clostridium sp.]
MKKHRNVSGIILAAVFLALLSGCGQRTEATDGSRVSMAADGIKSCPEINEAEASEDTSPEPERQPPSQPSGLREPPSLEAEGGPAPAAAGKALPGEDGEDEVNRFKKYQYLNDQGYCGIDIHEIYKDTQPVIWGNNALDRGDYYEMEACVDEYLTDDGSATECFFTLIRIRKDAVVSYMGNEIGLEEYGNYGREPEERSGFVHARMLYFEQDEKGYIRYFTDINGG